MAKFKQWCETWTQSPAWKAIYLYRKIDVRFGIKIRYFFSSYFVIFKIVLIPFQDSVRNQNFGNGKWGRGELRWWKRLAINLNKINYSNFFFKHSYVYAFSFKLTSKCKKGNEYIQKYIIYQWRVVTFQPGDAVQISNHHFFNFILFFFLQISSNRYFSNLILDCLWHGMKILKIFWNFRDAHPFLRTHNI